MNNLMPNDRTCNNYFHLPENFNQKQYVNPYGTYFGCIVPTEILSMQGLSTLAKLLYGQLIRYAGKNGKCFVTIKRLSFDLAKSESTISRSLHELKNIGLLDWISKPYSNNEYLFPYHEFMKNWNIKTIERDKPQEELFQQSETTYINPAFSHHAKMQYKESVYN
ncbi:MAG: helix-turn-helix domain-containing protein, partial [Candidatus Moranbacteria bacterium]|nr:helix-turn-helix domain-containing protein [Candidatus Moranbacteria bacterium]